VSNENISREDMNRKRDMGGVLLKDINGWRLVKSDIKLRES
jgi:hypothetical protein